MPASCRTALGIVICPLLYTLAILTTKSMAPVYDYGKGHQTWREVDAADALTRRARLVHEGCITVAACS